jgi:hypothetical protein
MPKPKAKPEAMQLTRTVGGLAVHYEVERRPDGFHFWCAEPDASGRAYTKVSGPFTLEQMAMMFDSIPVS